MAVEKNHYSSWWRHQPFVQPAPLEVCQNSYLNVKYIGRMAKSGNVWTLIIITINVMYSKDFIKPERFEKRCSFTAVSFCETRSFFGTYYWWICHRGAQDTPVGIGHKECREGRDIPHLINLCYSIQGSSSKQPMLMSYFTACIKISTLNCID